MGRAVSTRVKLGLVVVASTVAGALAGCMPTGDAVADHLFTGLLAGTVAFAAAAATPASLAVGALVLVVGGGAAWLPHVIGILALAVIVVLDRRPGGLTPATKAVLGGVVVQALLRLPWTAPVRGSAVVAAVGMMPVLVSGLLHAPRGSRRHLRLVRNIVLGVVLVLGAMFAFVVVRSHALLEAAERDARHGVDAARAGDRDQAAAAFARAARDFQDARDVTNSALAWPLERAPIIAQQVRAVDRVAEVGATTMPIVQSSVTKVDPDRLRLRNGRLDLATIAAYRPVFDDLAARTQSVRAELGDVSRTWLLPPLDDGLARFERTVARADDSAQTAADAVALAPELFGAHGDRTYFVAFVTPAEARASGGFMANYGVLVAHNGKLKLEKVGRGPDLDRAGLAAKHLTGPADYVARYGKFDVANTWENVTMSPDFPSVARVMAELYPQSGGRPVDGVIRIGPDALAGLLSLTGPIAVPGLPYSLNEHNVVDFLLRDQYTAIGDNDKRLDTLGVVARATFDQLMSGSSAKPSQIADAMAPSLREGDLAFWFPDAAAERFVHRLDADGAAPPVRGDGFGVTTQNGGGSKIDVYLHRTISYSVSIDGRTGAARAHADIELQSDAPSSGLPDYVIGNEVDAPRGTSRLYVSVYSPFVLRRATVDGRPVQFDAERELGRYAYSKFVDLPPGSTRTIGVDFTGSLDLASGEYRFDLLRQQLPNADRFDFALAVADARISGPDPATEPRFVVTNDGRRGAIASRRSRDALAFAVRLRR